MFIWEYIAQQSIEKICCITENKFTCIYTNEHICEWGKGQGIHKKPNIFNKWQWNPYLLYSSRFLIQFLYVDSLGKILPHV
jgi:hypothetical protein